MKTMASTPQRSVYRDTSKGNRNNNNKIKKKYSARSQSINLRHTIRWDAGNIERILIMIIIWFIYRTRQDGCMRGQKKNHFMQTIRLLTCRISTTTRVEPQNIVNLIAWSRT